MHRQDQDFGENLCLPIDERQNSCNNEPTYAQKEGSNMGEQMKKRQISAGLLAHV